MVEYSVILKRFKGSSRPDVCIFRDENRAIAILEMWKYCKKNGFSIHDSDGRYTIADIILIEKEPIAGSPILCTLSYHEIFDVNDNRRATQGGKA